MENETGEFAEIGRICTTLDRFYFKMKSKLIRCAEKGYVGWEDKDNIEMILKKLTNNLSKKDYVDVANLAMMLHFLTAPIMKE